MGFEFDAFEVAARCGQRPLSVFGLKLLDSAGLLDQLPVSRPAVEKLLRSVEDVQGTVPYHSSVHVMDVLQRLHAILAPVELSVENRLAAYLAAVIHDYRHGGVTNSYLVATDHFLARRYNNVSPWENFHAAEGLELIRRIGLLPDDVARPVSETVIQLVLATDMARHVDVMRSEGSDDPDMWLLKVAIKCADVGHAGAPVPVHARWVAALEAELQQQGAMERERGLPETWRTMHDSQALYFEVIVIPMFRRLAKHLPHTQPLLDQAVVNQSSYSWSATTRSAGADPRAPCGNPQTTGAPGG